MESILSLPLSMGSRNLIPFIRLASELYMLLL